MKSKTMLSLKGLLKKEHDKENMIVINNFFSQGMFDLGNFGGDVF